MAALRERGLDTVLAARTRAGRPLLGICLGLQLLAEASDESPGVPGLGVFSGTARRFTGDVRVPQLGWNRVEPDRDCALLAAGHAYFANSFALATPPRGWPAALARHGTSFVAALERGPVLACQFHPELSGRFGLELLRRWLARTP